MINIIIIIIITITIIIIREFGSTLYVGLHHAVPVTNTKFKPLLLLTHVGLCYTSTYKHRTSCFKYIKLEVYHHHFSDLSFIAEVNFWHPRKPVGWDLKSVDRSAP